MRSSTGNSDRRRAGSTAAQDMVRPVIVERSMHDQWLSNAYLVADQQGGHGVIIDCGAPPEPLLEAVERLELTVPYLLLTHHHHDHVAENHVYKERLGVEILAHPLEAEHLLDVDRSIEPGELVETGDLRIDGIHTPGHTAGMLGFPGDDAGGFTGGTPFKGAGGGGAGPGSHTLAGPQAAVMGEVVELPPGGGG